MTVTHRSRTGFQARVSQRFCIFDQQAGCSDHCDGSGYLRTVFRKAPIQAHVFPDRRVQSMQPKGQDNRVCCDLEARQPTLLLENVPMTNAT